MTPACLTECDGVGAIGSMRQGDMQHGAARGGMAVPVDGDDAPVVGVDWTIPPVFEYAAYLESGADNDPIETPECRGTLCSTLALTQATLAQRPALRVPCPVGATSLPCLQTDGGDSHIDAIARLALAFLHDGTGATCLVIAESTNGAYAALLATSGTLVTDRGMNIYRTNASPAAALVVIGDGVAQTGASAAGAWVINETRAIMHGDLLADTPDWNVYANDFTTSLASNSRARSGLVSAYPLGLYGKHGHTAGFFFTGYIQLVACWAQRLTTAQREAEQVNLETYFGGAFPL